MNQNNDTDEIKGTKLFIKRLSDLKSGDLSILRSHAGLDLDESLQGFDMFTGVWWYLRQKGWAPKRRVSWLITKLYAQFPYQQSPEFTLAKQLNKCIPSEINARNRFQSRFDSILFSPFSQLELHLGWALGAIRKNYSIEIRLDWVQLANDLSRWENERTKIKWAEEFLNIRN